MISLIVFIKTTPTEVVPSPPIKPLNETLEILSKVNEFYDTSWSKLIWLLTGAFAILGIFIPFIIQNYQKKKLKLNEEKLEAKVKSEIEEAKRKMSEEISKIIDTKIEQLKKDTEKTHDFFRGLILQLNASQLIDSGKYIDAVQDTITAVDMYIKCNDLLGIRNSLESVEFCLKKLSKDEIINLQLEVDFLKILNEIRPIDNSIVLSDQIKKIKELLKAS